MNAVRAITLSACFYVLRCLLADVAPATAGILRPLALETPMGSIVDALPPAAVAAGNVETSQRILGCRLRVGRGHRCLSDAAIRMARCLLRRNCSGFDYFLVAPQAARAGGLAPGTVAARAHRPAVPRRPRAQCADMRNHERRHPLCVVGTVYGAPRFLSMPVTEGGHGLNIVKTSTWTIVMQVGTFCGYVVFGYLADRFNRKYTYIGYLLIAALLVPLFAFLRNPNAPLLIGPLVGFLGTGYFSGFSVIASELFPTALRGSAMGFVYNIGRALSAAAPYLIGLVSEHAGFSYALCITSGAFLLAALIATALPSGNHMLGFTLPRS